MLPFYAVLVNSFWTSSPKVTLITYAGFPRKKVGSSKSNERVSTTIGTIGLPRLAPPLLTLTGSCKIYYVFEIKAPSPFSSLFFTSSICKRKKSYYHQYF